MENLHSNENTLRAYIDHQILPEAQFKAIEPFTEKTFRYHLMGQDGYCSIISLPAAKMDLLCSLPFQKRVFIESNLGRPLVLFKGNILPDEEPRKKQLISHLFKWEKDSISALLKLYARQENLAEKAGTANGIAPNGHNVMGFSRYRYFDLSCYFSLPFAMRTPKKICENKKYPLVIFLHGAGCGSEHNIRPLLLGLSMSNALKDKECILFVPSLPNHTGLQWHTFCSDENPLYGFPAILDHLFPLLLKEYPIDPERIYITGFSAGGQGTWNQLYLHPERYAAGIPLMAGDFPENDPAYFERIKGIPIWAGHSVTDRIVPVSSTDKMVDELQALQAPHIKYSRYEKWGHAMFHFFYHHEKWATWMLAQSNNTITEITNQN